MTCAHQRSDIVNHLGLWLLLYIPMASVHLGSIETGMARTLSEHTNYNGDQLDRECGVALPLSYSYGYGDWYITSIGNDTVYTKAYRVIGKRK